MIECLPGVIIFEQFPINLSSAADLYSRSVYLLYIFSEFEKEKHVDPASSKSVPGPVLTLVASAWGSKLMKGSASCLVSTQTFS